jgi:DNA-binding LytR/AlgR family response regulator
MKEKMIKIAVIDHSQTQRDALKKMVSDFGRENRTDIEIYEYENGRQALDNISKGFSIIILNHELEDISGVETARAIRRRDKSVLIIFVSSNAADWEDGFEVQAFHYLVSPLGSGRFKSVLAEAFKAVSEISKNLLIITEKGILILDLCEIICFKKHDDEYTDIVHISSGSIKTDKIKSPITDIENQIRSHGFVRPQNSCLVNPLHIKRIYGKNRKKYLETSLGEEILISRHVPGRLHTTYEH